MVKYPERVFLLTRYPTKPEPPQARLHNQKISSGKAHKIMSKVMTMKEAISKFIKSGDILFLSGMQHGEPSAAIHEITRQKIDHLTLVSALIATANLLIGEGLVDKMITGSAPS
jgi:hypothetical protein